MLALGHVFMSHDIYGLSLQAVAVLVSVLALFGSAVAQNDIDILNFALNLECLEAAFYTCAAFGVNLTDAYLGRAFTMALRCLYFSLG